MQIGEIMTANPACCTPDTRLNDVARMMEQNDCGCIPVVGSFSGMEPIGTITDRDITIRTVAANQNPVDMKASDVMTADIATVTPQASIEECLGVMEGRGIRRVLVVDAEEKLCGIVAQADVVQSAARPLRTNKAIREISESSPSKNENAVIRMRAGRKNAPQSFVTGGGLIPLLVGLGAGSALTYFLGKRSDSVQRGYSEKAATYPSDVERLVDAANSEPIGKYRDADEEIEKRQQLLENRVQSVLTELDSVVGEGADCPDEDQTSGDNKGRSVGQA
jgi:CBS domain-containing protein